jgi:hypothetical protein
MPRAKVAATGKNIPEVLSQSQRRSLPPSLLALAEMALFRHAGAPMKVCF